MRTVDSSLPFRIRRSEMHDRAELTNQAYKAGDNQVDCNDEVQKLWKDQNQYPRNEGENRLMNRHNRRHFELLP